MLLAAIIYLLLQTKNMAAGFLTNMTPRAEVVCDSVISMTFFVEAEMTL
jgi:hypothetical protein